MKRPCLTLHLGFEGRGQSHCHAIPEESRCNSKQGGTRRQGVWEEYNRTPIGVTPQGPCPAMEIPSGQALAGTCRRCAGAWAEECLSPSGERGKEDSLCLYGDSFRQGPASRGDMWQRQASSIKAAGCARAVCGKGGKDAEGAVSPGASSGISLPESAAGAPSDCRGCRHLKTERRDCL